MKSYVQQLFVNVTKYVRQKRQQ